MYDKRTNVMGTFSADIVALWRQEEPFMAKRSMLSVVHAPLQGGLISLSHRETKWIVKKAVPRLNASLLDKAIYKFWTIQVRHDLMCVDNSRK